MNRSQRPGPAPEDNQVLAAGLMEEVGSCGHVDGLGDRPGGTRAAWLRARSCRARRGQGSARLNLGVQGAAANCCFG